ncbi:hypothetical protein C0Q70_06657 [Pomacea canaliculata]|uniref:PRKR-interacting protein 1 n=1 Tax=Pomacea canaliculata TaxID=400727 RepID=A0A2T7PCU2_POMCA|nr:PRKR-interacting protein 1 homolog [Pomacea canaliculata]PVD31245.1 hypothetical protein C0Q70_06657 [Pomacea canaliculata]
MATKEKASTGSVAVAKTPADLQRMRLEKLMAAPVKPVFIPEKSKGAKMKEPPEFIRNVWGSSAGAGSGDFHVYRGVRRREYARQKFTAEQNDKMDKDEKYHIKVEENKKAAEERTAKKRAKRLKKKEKLKSKKARKDNKPSGENSDEDEKHEDNEDGNTDDQVDENSQPVSRNSRSNKDQNQKQDE